MTRIFRFLSGFMFGALLGGFLAIILTPESGDSLRTKVTQSAHKLREEVNRAALEKRAELEKELIELKSNIQIG